MYLHVAYVRYATCQVRERRGIDQVKLFRRVLNAHDIRPALASASVERIQTENPSLPDVKVKAVKAEKSAQAAAKAVVPSAGGVGDAAKAAAAKVNAADSADAKAAAAALAKAAEVAKAAEAAAAIAAAAAKSDAAIEEAREARAAKEKALTHDAFVAAHGGLYLHEGRVDNFFAAKNPANTSVVSGTTVTMRGRAGTDLRDQPLPAVVAFAQHNGIISSFRERPCSNGGRARRAATTYQVLITKLTDDNKTSSKTVPREKIGNPGVANEEAHDPDYLWVDVDQIKDARGLPLRIPDTVFSSTMYDEATPPPLPPPPPPPPPPPTPTPQSAQAAEAAQPKKAAAAPAAPPRDKRPRLCTAEKL